MDEKNSSNSDLDPEVIKVRDKIISKIGDKPLEEVNSIIKKLLNESMDDVTRLGALAARLKIIRSKIELLYEKKVDIRPKETKKVVNKTTEEKSEDKTIESEEKWIRVKMLEAAEVNGKQIDKGVILDVKEGDSQKLINTKKAEIVDEESEGAAPIEKSKETPIEKSKETDEKVNVSQNKETVKKTEQLSEKTNEEAKLKKEENKDPSVEQKKEVNDEKSKNLLEKHEDAVSDDDSAEENKKESEPPKETNEVSKTLEDSENIIDKEGQKSNDDPESLDNEMIEKKNSSDDLKVEEKEVEPENKSLTEEK